MNGSQQIYAALADRIRADYREVPGLRLTVAQAARFWGIEIAVCERALHELEQTGFLDRRRNGSYAHREPA
jgi:DNA-binding transcriptional regulator YhcF (GntR family)